jgi:hypothetical protein
MHCLRAAVALVAAMMYSLSAAGQTRPAAKIGTIPGKVAIRRLSPNPVSPNVAGTKIPKRNVPTFIAGLAEIDPDTCKEVPLPGGAGTWTVTLNPMFGATSTKIETGTAAPGQPCAGDTFTFNDIYYTWTAHNNHTTTPNQGPTDIFNATWSTPDGEFNDPFVFNVVTHPVRPKGEISTLVNWLDSKGIWEVTLQCCAPPDDDDAAFDFTGETVNEVFQSDQNSCPDVGSSNPSMGTVNSGPPGLFHDRVGFDPCAVHYERCIKKHGCGFVIKQQMEINSPADPSNTFFPYGSAPNTLSSRIEGSIIVQLAGKLSVRDGIGQVTSQRSTPLSQNDPVPHDFPSDKLSCFASGTDFILYLRMLDLPC